MIMTLSYKYTNRVKLDDNGNDNYRISP